MAIVPNTALRYDSVGERESLSDKIYRISPTDVPFMSAIGVGPKADQTLVEWQTDELAAAADNAKVEADEQTYDAVAETVRVGNYTQIMSKNLVLSNTRAVTLKAGRKSERAFILAKKALELKRDMEFGLVGRGGTAAVAGDSTTARRFAPLRTWIKSNTSLGATGANSTYTSGVPTVAVTDGTQRAFTKALLDAVIQSAWAEGGSPRILMVGPFNKTVVSAFAGIASMTFDISKAQPGTIIGAADVYVSNFGTIRVVPNRFQRERDAFLIDPELAALRYLRPFHKEEMAKTGDATKDVLRCEFTLEVKQEAGLGCIADLATS